MDEATRRRIRREIETAGRKIEAARACHERGLHEDAFSRAYYAMFHAAMALLAVAGERPRTHRGVSVRLLENFVKPGRMDRVHFDALVRARELREYGDYEAGWVADADAAREAIESARRFVEAARVILDTEGAVD